MLTDNHGRPVNYLRLAVTDRCNLRCEYCMPEKGVEFLPRAELLTYEEMLRLVRLLAQLGIEKVRITGGEPFLRRDFMPFLRALAKTPGLQKIALTTNGTLTEPHLPELARLGIRDVNLSLDTLDPARFWQITRRNEFEKVWRSLEKMLELGFSVKLNSVVMAGKNDVDIVPMVELTRHLPVAVRFIEEMPFNGEGVHFQEITWNWQRIQARIAEHFPGLERLPDPPNSTSMNFKIPGHLGTVGIIAAYSRTFCGTCNRLRLTPLGQLKTCLYDNGIFNIRDLLRAGATDAEVQTAVLQAVGNRARDGHEAERLSQKQVWESMTAIGG